MRNKQTKYDKFPYLKMNNSPKNSSWQGYQGISNEIIKKISNEQKNKDKVVITFDFYHGIKEHEVLNNLISKINGTKINVQKAKYSEKYTQELLKRNLTDDKVFGILSNHSIDEFFDDIKVNDLRKKITDSKSKVVVVYGVGSSYVAVNPDIIIYFDLSRWEIQQRLRNNELDNWGAENFNEDILRKYKRGFFIEWRTLDRYKKSLFNKINYLVDTNLKNNPKMITGSAFKQGLKQFTNQPFRLVPFFDSGVWGGQWMKEKFDLDSSQENYAWGFDCVPEENSLRLKVNDVIVEFPAQNLVMAYAKELLGEKIYARFGAEFPIRFDLLDTIQGQNLSLQVHPVTEYIQEKFAMHYTQDESYYILDAQGEPYVYLGLKENVNKEDLFKDLYIAQSGKESFNDEKFINKFPAKKHDHFLIPAGTVHCSGKNLLILEISATPYIFTFKLWDWGRVGLNGIPRPIHLEHGKNVIEYSRDTKWVKQNLINQVQLIHEEEGIKEERTGLAEQEFIETRRHWFNKTVTHHTNNQLNVLNLIEGDEAIVESQDNKFEPFIVHYSETFIIPAQVDSYTITPHGASKGKTIATIKAFVIN